MAHSVTAARQAGDCVGERGETVPAETAKSPAPWRALPLSPPTASADLYRSGAIGVYFGLLSLPVGRWLPGVIELPGAQGLGARLAAWLPLGADELDAHLDALAAAGLLQLDREHGLVYAPVMVSVGVPTSIKQIEGIRAQWLRLRQSAVVEQARQDLLAAVDALEPVRKARGRSKPEPERTIAERLREALGCHLVSLPARPLHPQQPLPLVPCLRVVREEEPVTQQDLPRAVGVGPVTDAPKVPVDPEELLRRQFEEEDRVNAQREAEAATRRDLAAATWNDRERVFAAQSDAQSVGAGTGVGREDRSGIRVLPSGSSGVGTDAPAHAGRVPSVLRSGVSGLADGWRAIASRVKRLRRPGATATGLTLRLESTLAGNWQVAQQEGFALADLRTLGDWLEAGALSWVDDLPGHVVRNLSECLASAKAWAEMGRPALRKGPAPRKFLGGGR